jgi:hypothetical protein
VRRKRGLGRGEKHRGKEIINSAEEGTSEMIEAPRDDRLTPHDPEFEKKMAKAEEIISRYCNTLHALARKV